MAGVRKALIVATDQYSDPKLTRLNAPAEDARALAEVLRDPDVGAYDVQTVLNKTCQEVEIAIASFFQSGARDDTLLVHFSCHGVKDLSGELYFATTDTKLPLLKVTGVSSSMVKQAMEESRASLILCLVDCCYSGAFTKSTKAAATVDLTERLGGRGRAVITASTSLQLALDGQHQASLFTHAVVEGLQSGEADRDLDGLVTLDEFYNYIHEKVTETNPDQTPVKSFDVQGEVYVARRGAPITTPAPLPRELVETLATGEDWQRLGAVSRLTDLLNAGHPGRALGARQALEQVRDNDDSIKVRKMAEAALAGAGDTEAIPLIPAYVEGAPAERASVTSDSAEFATAGSKGGPVTTEEPVVQEPAVEVKPVDMKPVVDVPVPVPPPPTPVGPGGPTGGGGMPPTPAPIARWKKIVVVGFAAMGAILMALIALGLLVGDDEGGGNDGGNGGATDDIVPLAKSELLLVLTDDAGNRQLVALDVNSPDRPPRAISLPEVYLPTIGEDRKRIYYLLRRGEPRRIQVDGLTDGAPLLDAAGRSQCPRSNRPAERSDGGKLALVCKDASQKVLGLFVADRDGGNLTHVVQDSTPAEGPTWDNGSGDVTFVAYPNGPLEPSRLMTVPPVEASTPTEIDIGLSDWWLSNPDWSDGRLLFLRSIDKDEPGDVCFWDGHGVTQLTRDVEAEAPAWSPDGRFFAYLAPSTEDSSQLSLWVQPARAGARATEIPVDGIPGPPAWGTR